MGYKDILEYKKMQREKLNYKYSLEGFLEERKKRNILSRKNKIYIDVDIDLDRIKENNKIEDSNLKRR